MQLLASTPFAAVLFIFLIYLGPYRGLWVLFLSLPFGAAAAFQAPGLGNVLLADACLMALWVSMVGRVRITALTEQLAPDHPGFVLLAILMLALLSAGFFPRLFADVTEVFAVVQGDNGAVIETVYLQPSGANISQLLRLTLGISAFVAVAAICSNAASWRLIWRAVFTCTVAHICVSLVDWLGHALGFADVLSPFRSVSQAVLADQNFPGLRRVIGGYTEPASFGLFTMGLVGFWMRAAISDCFDKHAWFFLSVLVILALRSTSTATIFNLFVFSSLFLLINRSAFAARRERLVVCIVLFSALPTAYSALSLNLGYSPMGSDLMDAMIWDKARSSSGEERTLWNQQALRNFFDTSAVGAGIGSARSSGWIFAVLSNLGVVGLALFAWFLVGLFRGCRPNGSPHCASELAACCRWGCFALALQSCLTRPFPDLGVFFFAMAGAAIGLSRRHHAELAPAVKPRMSAWG